MEVNRDDLYTMRWAARNGKPETVIATLDRLLGPAPVVKPAHGKTRIALVVGHNPSAQGADSPYLHTSEFSFNSRVASLLASAGGDGLEFQVFHRRALGSYSREIAEVYREVTAFDPLLAVELHFNAGGGNYCCCLAARDSETGGHLAAVLSESISEVLGLRSIGVVRRSASDRGGASLYAAKCPVVLMEPFFGDSKDNCATVTAEKLAAGYLAGLKLFLQAA